MPTGEKDREPEKGSKSEHIDIQYDEKGQEKKRVEELARSKKDYEERQKRVD